MAEYRRFIAYIYEYTNGKKNKNTGFAKVESRNGICRIQVHLQNIPQEEESLSIYGFVREGEWLLGIFLGRMEEKQTEVRITTHSDNLGNSGYALEQIAGLWVEGKGISKYLTVFDEEQVDTEKLVTALPEPKEKVHRKEAKQEEQEQEKTSVNAEESAKVEEETHTEKPESSSEDKNIEATEEFEGKNIKEAAPEEERGNAEEEKEASSDVHTQETVPCRQNRYRCPAQFSCPDGIHQGWECMSRRYPHFQPFSADGEVADCLRITPGDLGLLRQGNWRMGNNSFVMHGYYNYRHILFGKRRDGNYILGIPGIYENQELFMASMFGFPDFLEAADQEKERKFGYWCRQLS